MNRGLTNDRLIASLTSAFGIVALMLACLGLYGTISYGVARRISELGLRMALGADRATVAWLVVREALTLVGIGAALGLPLAFVAGRSILSLLHGVDPVDPASYSQATVLLADRGRHRRLPARASRVADRSDGGVAVGVGPPARHWLATTGLPLRELRRRPDPFSLQQMPPLVLRYDLQPRSNGEPKHWNERILEPDVVHVVVACAMDEFTYLAVAAEESLENRRLDA